VSAAGAATLTKKVAWVVAPPTPGAGVVDLPMPASVAVAPPMLLAVLSERAPQLLQVSSFPFVVVPWPAACGLLTSIAQPARQPSAGALLSPLLTLPE